MYRVNFGNKYHAKRQEYNGILYDSKLEAGYAAELDLRVKAGDIKRWERQVKISLDINGYHISNYYCDFLLFHNDGTKEYVECKGMELEPWKTKWKIFEALMSKKKRVKLTVQK